MGAAPQAESTGGGGEVDDPAAPVLQVGKGRLIGVHGAAGVDAHDQVPFLVRDRLGWGVALQARGVDQDVQSAHGRDRLIDRFAHRCPRRHVARRVGQGAGNEVSSLIDGRRCDVQPSDGGAGGGQSAGRAGTYAACGAGDDDLLVRQGGGLGHGFSCGLCLISI
ncbi:hypothetical protein D3C77_243070 [compost metagenome]